MPLACGGTTERMECISCQTGSDHCHGTLIVHVDGMFGRNKIECTQEDCVDRLLARHGFIVDCVDLAGGCGCAATATGYRRAG